MDRQRFHGKGKMKKIMMLKYAIGLAAEEPRYLRRIRYQDRYHDRYQDRYQDRHQDRYQDRHQDGSRTPLAFFSPSMTVLSKQGRKLALEKAVSKYLLSVK